MRIVRASASADRAGCARTFTDGLREMRARAASTNAVSGARFSISTPVYCNLCRNLAPRTLQNGLFCRYNNQRMNSVINNQTIGLSVGNERPVIRQATILVGD